METQKLLPPGKARFQKRYIIIVITFLVLVIILGWVGLTRAGYIANYLQVPFLEPPYHSLLEENGALNSSVSCTSEDCPDLKPVIYLYPTKEQNVKVVFDYKGELTATYPDYDKNIKGWEVTAYPNGKLINKADGQEYSYLFWEGIPSEKTNYDLSKGFVVEGRNTKQFLQEILPKLGLTPKEYNEFIVYWYPQMQNNKYNLIHFATKSEYEDKAVLDISPKPDSILRVFMVYKSLEEVVNVEPQEIKSFARKGFSVIEWGGTEVK